MGGVPNTKETIMKNIFNTYYNSPSTHEFIDVDRFKSLQDLVNFKFSTVSDVYRKSPPSMANRKLVVSTVLGNVVIVERVWSGSVTYELHTSDALKKLVGVEFLSSPITPASFAYIFGTSKTAKIGERVEGLLELFQHEVAIQQPCENEKTFQGMESAISGMAKAVMGNPPVGSPYYQPMGAPSPQVPYMQTRAGLVNPAQMNAFQEHICHPRGSMFGNTNTGVNFLHMEVIRLQQNLQSRDDHLAQLRTMLQNQGVMLSQLQAAFQTMQQSAMHFGSPMGQQANPWFSGQWSPQAPATGQQFVRPVAPITPGKNQFIHQHNGDVKMASTPEATETNKKQTTPTTQEETKTTDKKLPPVEMETKVFHLEKIVNKLLTVVEDQNKKFDRLMRTVENMAIVLKSNTPEKATKLSHILELMPTTPKAQAFITPDQKFAVYLDGLLIQFHHQYTSGEFELHTEFSDTLQFFEQDLIHIQQHTPTTEMIYHIVDTNGDGHQLRVSIERTATENDWLAITR